MISYPLLRAWGENILFFLFQNTQYKQNKQNRLSMHSGFPVLGRTLNAEQRVQTDSYLRCVFTSGKEVQDPPSRVLKGYFLVCTGSSPGKENNR